MKLLMFYAPEFWFKTFEKSLADAADADVEQTVSSAVVVFYQCEVEDADRLGKVVTKAVKNIKWLCGKFDTRTVVLHSFGHLSASKADPDISRRIIEAVQQRLDRVDFELFQTPFGYLNEWRLHVAGPSLAKVFKDI